MTRRVALVWTLLSSTVFALNFRERTPKAWTSKALTKSVAYLYGNNKLANLIETPSVVLNTPKGIVQDQTNITIGVQSVIPAKSVAVLCDGNVEPLIVVFTVPVSGMVEYEFSIGLEMKGTLFAVVEGLDGKLYYARAFIDVLNFKCGAS